MSQITRRHLRYSGAWRGLFRTQLADQCSRQECDRYGAPRKNILLKFFPPWWFYNSDEPTPPAWYEPGTAQWLRVFYWYCRNPLYNFGKYVLGCRDINYTVTGTSPVLVNLLADIGQTGWKHSFIWLYGFIPLPFVSYPVVSCSMPAGCRRE